MTVEDAVEQLALAGRFDDAVTLIMTAADKAEVSSWLSARAQLALRLTLNPTA